MREKKSGIYCIENLVNGKKYIGLAVDITYRLNGHVRDLNNNRHRNNYLQKAWNKNGKNNFKLWIIEECPRDKELLSLMEIYFICYYDSFWEDGGGYNLTRGGDGAFGYIVSEETKKLMSKSRQGEKHSMWGKHHSEESRKKMRDAKLGTHPSEKTKKLMSIAHSGEKNHNFGKHSSEATRKLITESQTGEKNHNFGKKFPKASSLYFGVIFYKNYNGWRARSGKKHIGYYKTEIDAAKAYDKYIIENNINRPLNFPEDYK